MIIKYFLPVPREILFKTFDICKPNVESYHVRLIGECQMS